jgi:hypothetical protein
MSPTTTGISQRPPTPEPAGFVSCDIIGHSSIHSHEIQAARVSALNKIFAETIASGSRDEVVWASGGDGGHLVFFGGNWHLRAVDLIEALRRWAITESVPLRVTAHAGRVGTVAGADGRTQPVGDGINEAGSILALGTDCGLVVSREFADEIQNLNDDRIRLHDQRPLGSKIGEHELLLMSLPHLPSEWGPSLEDASVLLRAAVERRAAWEALYQAKRILQVNSADREVNQMLRRLRPTDYWSNGQGEDDAAINPFLAQLDGRSLREILRLSQLVERSRNDYICHYGDEGDTMFVILRGQVGVYNLAGAGELLTGEPGFVLGEGQIVGELSFALNRRRTADLVCLAPTVLLAFSHDELPPRLANAPAGEDILASVSKLVTSRVLEHVAHAVPFLIGRDRTGPLASMDTPWESLLEDLLFDCRTLEWASADGVLSLKTIDVGMPANAAKGGLYFLVGGCLESRSNPRKSLDGDEYPLLYVDLSGAALPDHEYGVSGSSATILHVGSEGIASLPPTTQNAILGAVKQQLACRYYYDAFLSFNFGDEQTARTWRDRLTDAGLEIYLDEPEPGIQFASRLEEALMDSLTLLAFISPHTMVKPEEQNWVHKEIAYREAQFVNPWIFPVRLRGGDPERFLLPYTMIDASVDEEQAIKDVVDAISAIREGKRQPPMPVPGDGTRRLS